ncbi:MAG: hypothetical protein WDZ45_06010 [Flavobacteriaceae bacterium]
MKKSNVNESAIRLWRIGAKRTNPENLSPARQWRVGFLDLENDYKLLLVFVGKWQSGRIPKTFSPARQWRVGFLVLGNGYKLLLVLESRGKADEPENLFPSPPMAGGFSGFGK